MPNDDFLLAMIQLCLYKYNFDGSLMQLKHLIYIYIYIYI